MEQKIVEKNGVDREKLQKACDLFRQKPELAQSVFRVKNEWISGGHNQITVNDYYTGKKENRRDEAFCFQADEPPALLGADRGANPVEYLLTALSSCMTTSIVYHAAARGIAVEKIESRFEGDLDLRGFLGLDPSVEKGYSRIRATFLVKTEGSKENIEELYAFSPVYAMVSRSVPIDVSIQIV